MRHRPAILLAGILLAWAVLASPATAALLWVDSGTVINSGDSMLVTEGGASADGVMEACNQSSSCVLYNATNGAPLGTVTRWGYRANATSGQQRYYDTPNFAPASSARIAARVRVANIASANRVILRLREDNNNDGAPDADGCGLRLNFSDRTVQLVHGTTTVGTVSAQKLQTQYCTGNTCTTDKDCGDINMGVCIAGTCHNPERACTTGGQATDCPADPDGGGPLVAQTCATCSPSDTTSAGCYVGDVAVTEVSQGNAVFCTAYIDGETVAAGTLIPVTIGPVVAARFGANGTEAGALDATFGSIRYGNDDNPGRGYVAPVGPLGPNAACLPTGKCNQWTNQSCGGGSGTNHVQCVHDYLVSPYSYGSAAGDLRTSVKSREERFQRVSPLPTLRGGDVVPMIQVDIAGTTSTQAGTRQLAVHAGTCTSDGKTCSWDAGTTLNLALNTAVHYQGRHASYIAPVSGSTGWAANLHQLGLQFKTTANNVENTRVGMIAASLAVRYPDVPLPTTLLDRNVGADDGQVSICVNGNSLNGGTFATTCQGGTKDGEACSGEFYCAHIETRDAVCGADAVCQVCANRQKEFGNVGYPCGPNNPDSPGCNLGNCTGGTCASDTTVSCTTAADCDLGTCSGCTDANCSGQTPQGQCLESCPGGSCPTARATPCDELPRHIGAQSIQCFSQGAETNAHYETTRLVSNLNGMNGPIETPAGLIAGFGRHVVGTGSCTCTTDADCPGGTCSVGKRCQAPAARATCTSDEQCGSTSSPGYHKCAGLPCDYLIQIDESDNDQDTPYWGGTNNCAGPSSVGWMGASAASLTGPRLYCDQCNALLCVNDSTCTGSRSASSQCLAGRRIGSGVMCTDQAQARVSTNACTTDATCGGGKCVGGFCQQGWCTVDVDVCNTSADCTNGRTCTGGTPGHPRPTGECTCTVSGSCTIDANCASGNCIGGQCHSCPKLQLGGASYRYQCSGTAGRCRLQCSVNADCGPSGSCSGGVCQSLCTCPGDSTDMPNFPNAGACTTDADCPRGSRSGLGLTRAWAGRCQSGKCVCSGLATCLDPADPCYKEAARWRAETVRDSAFGSLLRMRSLVNAQAAGPDGRLPRFLVTTLPDVGFGGVCNDHRPDTALKHQTNALTLQTFAPWAIDMKGAMAGFENNVCHPDRIHWTGPCSAAGGGIGSAIAPGIGAYLQAWNTCAINAPGPRQRPQRFCRQANGTWTSTECVREDPSRPAVTCPAGQFCRVRPCTVDNESQCPGPSICNLEP